MVRSGSPLTIVSIDPGFKGKLVVLDVLSDGRVLRPLTLSFPIYRSSSGTHTYESKKLQEQFTNLEKELRRANRKNIIATIENIQIHGGKVNKKITANMLKQTGRIEHILSIVFGGFYRVAPSYWKAYWKLTRQPKKASIDKAMDMVGIDCQTADEADAVLLGLAHIDYLKIGKQNPDVEQYT